MKRFLECLILGTVLLLCGCKKEEPNPELRDPIYRDLEKRAADAQKNLDVELAKLKPLREKVLKAEANTIDRKDLEKELRKAEATALALQQDAKYYKIRAQRRLLVDRIAYSKAFAKGETWPDPREYSDYLLNIRLRSVNLNWNSRIPKLQSRLENRAPAAKPAEKPAGGGGH